MNNVINFLPLALLIITQLWKFSLAAPLAGFTQHEDVDFEENKNTLVRSRRETSGDQECNSFKTGNETWHGHNESIYRWNKKDKVEIYTEQTNPASFGKWLLPFTSKVWEYMRGTYGEFGRNPCLFLMIHGYRSNHVGGTIVYSLNGSSVPSNFNILDLPSYNETSWEKREKEEIDLVTNHLAYFVEFSSKEKLGSLSYNIWKRSSGEHTAWVDIFTYDIYKSLNFTRQESRYKTQSLLKSDPSDFPKNDTYWFRNWFLPIYDNYGGSKVLNRYFQLLKDELGPKHESINMGTFVHFWSTAARVNLISLATEAFGWNETFQTEFNRAREKYCENKKCIYDETAGTSIKVTPREDNDNNQPYYEHGSSEDDPGYVSKTEEHTTPYINLNMSTTLPSKSVNPTPLTETRQDEKSEVVIVASASAAAMTILILVFVLFILFYKKQIRTLKTDIRALTTEEVDEFFEGDPNAKLLSDMDHELIQSLPFIKDYEISKDQIILAHDKVIGTGQFGYVVHGFVRFSDKDENELVKVAVKMVRPNIDVVYFKAFLSEVKIMAYLGKHENIVSLLGTCTANIKDREIFIALELCPFGSLLDYMKKNRHIFEEKMERSTRRSFNVTQSIHALQLHSGILNNFNPDTENVLSTITTKDMLKWSHNVANAMVYLQQKKVIHGDLACRNVLLTADRTAKICDFGLSRQVLNYANYMKTSNTPVPWRWLAIECMKEQRFSAASDVWAFGVLLWEIFSLGEIPYGCYTYDLFFVDKLVAGERLLQPTHANADMYQLMRDCWKTKPEERINFHRIFSILDTILSKPLDAVSDSNVLQPSTVNFDVQIDSGGQV